MKIKQKLISLILSFSIAMGLATAPAFASSPDTSYFMNSQRYYWSGASGTHDLPSSTKLGNLVALGIDYISLDLAAVNSSLGQLYTLVNTGLGTINTSLLPISELKTSNWGSSLNLYSIPSGYGSSWYAQILRGFYDIKSLSQDIKSYLFTVTGNQTSIINKLNSGVDVSLDSVVEGYLQNTSEQLTTQSGILNTYLPGIKSDTSNIIDIKSLLNSNINVPWSYFYRYYNSQNNDTLPAIVTGNGLLNLGFYKAGSDATLRIQQSVSNYSTNPMQAIGVLNNNVVNMGSLIYGLYRYYPRTTYNSTTNKLQEVVTSSGSGRAYSIMDSLQYIHDDLLLPLAKLQFFIADDQSIQAKKDNINNENAFLNNFTGSGSASATPSDFVGVKDSVSALKTSLSGGASYTQAFNILGGDSDGWSWFTQEVADSMDTTNSNRNLLRGDISSFTPYLNSYYDSIFSVIGVGGDIE